MDRIRVVLLAGLLLALALPFAGCGDQDTAPPGADYRVYSRTSQGYSVRYPRTWQLLQNTEGYDVLGTSPLDVAGDPYREQMGVAVVALDYPPPSLELYYLRNVLALTEQLTDFHLVSNGDTVVDGADARWLQFTYTDGGQALECYEIVIVSGRRAYVTITTTLQSEYPTQRDLLREMAHSFRLSGRAADTTQRKGETPASNGPAAAAMRAGGVR